ncbi:hypothetical protein [Microbacterium paraoxydans]|uniref:hypothetical protein n=1 Tax=Microbacterium paraoxydans TaxID=199592 RepID=UPI0028EB9BB8|nr:hypothetical protein [Microbacterium paraoxydans]
MTNISSASVEADEDVDADGELLVPDGAVPVSAQPVSTRARVRAPVLSARGIFLFMVVPS